MNNSTHYFVDNFFGKPLIFSKNCVTHTPPNAHPSSRFLAQKYSFFVTSYKLQVTSYELRVFFEIPREESRTIRCILQGNRKARPYQIINCTGAKFCAPIFVL